MTATPEYLAEEVRNMYGIDIPLETVITYIESDPYLTPESLYDYYTRYDLQSQQSAKSFKLKGYNFVDFSKDGIPNKPGVYIWILKDNASLPSIEGYAPNFNLVEYKKKCYRVLYVGQAKTESLYERVVKKHLRGNPRQSTLCWSIAAIMGYPFQINEKRKPVLDRQYCDMISQWLYNNCYLLCKVCKDIDAEELKQIKTFTPPVNLDKNPMRNSDPFIMRVSQYRHIPGGYNGNAPEQKTASESESVSASSSASSLEGMGKALLGILLFIIIAWIISTFI